MLDVTRLAPSAPTPTPTSGWLTSSGAIDHGRFAPGTILGGRYRVIGRLGKGGMGEVYRADDLKLGQPVALKFLPPDVDRDPARLTQLHTEVRMARQVSHPNVCRVYDIDEVEGHTFLSMEYVDGEDLASLLRRIGRFPEDRALAGEQLVEHETERVDVAARRHLAAGELFGRHVGRRPGADRFAREPGEAEVGDPHPARAIEHHVGRLEVTMEHTALVRCSQTCAKLASQLERFVLWEAAYPTE